MQKQDSAATVQSPTSAGGPITKYADGYCTASASTTMSYMAQPASSTMVPSASTTTVKTNGTEQDPNRSKRLDEDLEQLDQHLMDITLKNVKYMHGSKFTVFSDVAFQRDFLEAHNSIRVRHNCQHLTWCQDLAEQALEWAHHVAEKGRVLYRDQPNIGENVMLITTNGTNHLPTGAEVTNSWAKQSEKYDFSSPKWSVECQNFTQLIWKSTQKVGAGRVWLQSKGVVAIVGFYFPRGNRNLHGEFQKNVLPPLLPK